MDGYLVPFEAGESAFVEKRSRFISHLWRVESEAEARRCIEEMKKTYYDARHNCWCYLLREGGVVRYSDDGEPQGTAGQPMLNVLQREAVVNVCCVVTRYFGGVLLGTGGLVRAYTQATQAGIQAAELVVVSRCVDIDIRTAYAKYDQLVRISADCGAKVLDTEYDDAVTLHLRMLDGTQQLLLTKLTELERGQENVCVSDPLEAAF